MENEEIREPGTQIPRRYTFSARWAAVDGAPSVRHPADLQSLQFSRRCVLSLAPDAVWFHEVLPDRGTSASFAFTRIARGDMVRIITG